MNMNQWWKAVAAAVERPECCDGDGNITARFWTDGARIWATPGNIWEPNARHIEYSYEKGVGYVPVTPL